MLVFGVMWCIGVLRRSVVEFVELWNFVVFIGGVLWRVVVFNDGVLWSSVLFYAVVLSIVMLYVGVLWSCGVLCWTVVELWCFMVESCGE